MNESPAIEIVCNLADKSDLMITEVDPHVRVLPNELTCTDVRLTNTVQEATDVDAAGPARTQSPVIELFVWLVAHE